MRKKMPTIIRKFKECFEAPPVLFYDHVAKRYYVHGAWLGDLDNLDNLDKHFWFQKNYTHSVQPQSTLFTIRRNQTRNLSVLAKMFKKSFMLVTDYHMIDSYQCLPVFSCEEDYQVWMAFCNANLNSTFMHWGKNQNHIVTIDTQLFNEYMSS